VEVAAWLSVLRAPDVRRWEEARDDDDRILNELSQRLTQDRELHASRIVVMVQDHVVTLEGAAITRSGARRAEILAADLKGVRQVWNHLGVLADLPTPSGPIGSASA
jgi:osmotically-inducible protein OsmY